MTIRITVQMLRELGACQEGIDDFLDAFGEVWETEWTQEDQKSFILSPMRKWFGWGISTKLFPLWSMRGANFRGANLREANLRGANLQGANLWRANLQAANLQEVNLRGVNLWGANLQGANLQAANLQGANLQGAIIPKV